MMRIFLAMAALLCLSTISPAAEVNLNPEWGDAPYQAPSIFRPGLDDGDALPDKVVVVFHGFKSAVPNGTFKRIYKLFKKTHAVIGVNYRYFDIRGTMAQLDTLAGDLAGRDVTVLGTSLGGFWADWFGNRIGANKVVIVNPTTEPARTLAKYIGKTVESERRAVSFGVSAEEVGRYSDVAVVPNANVKTLVILSVDDAHMDYRIAEAVFKARPGAVLELFETGGHTINLKKHPARESIRDFVLAD